MVGRAELLAAIFFILSFTFYNKSRQHDNNSGTLQTLLLHVARHYMTLYNVYVYTHTGRSNAWLLGSLFLAVLSMLSKEQGITVVAVCVVCDFIHNFQVYVHDCAFVHVCIIILYLLSP